jgi:hypothetical protein
MSDRAIERLRAAIVAGYALIAWGLEHDGVTIEELTTLAVTMVILLVVIVSLRWIANGPRGGDE